MRDLYLVLKATGIWALRVTTLWCNLLPSIHEPLMCVEWHLLNCNPSLCGHGILWAALTLWSSFNSYVAAKWWLWARSLVRKEPTGRASHIQTSLNPNSDKFQQGEKRFPIWHKCRNSWLVSTEVGRVTNLHEHMGGTNWPQWAIKHETWIWEEDVLGRREEGRQEERWLWLSDLRDAVHVITQPKATLTLQASVLRPPDHHDTDFALLSDVLAFALLNGHL